MEYDVIIVGAGPAGLAAAIKLKQLAAHANTSIRVCVLDKGASVGAHILSGAVLCPRSLQALLPDTWQNAPLSAKVSEDRFYYLTKKHAIRLPTPKQMKNKDNYIIRLGELCQFLAQEAENLGCDIYAGFPAKEVIYDNNQVIGIKTGEVGIDKQGHHTANYQPGMPLHATYTLFAEGCRGELSQELMSHFGLRQGVQPQTYALGIKEVWKVSNSLHHEGRVVHTIGWPLDTKTYGGSFIYHLPQQQIAIGYVVGLDYENTWLDPFAEMQRFKTHPFIKPILLGGERIAYGARTLNEGGWQSIPKLTFPGGALIGDAAGFLNVPQIKGIHTAMQSGMFAATACFEKLFSKTNKSQELTAYTNKINNSWVAKELYRARNIRPGFKFGLTIGMVNAFMETYITRGHTPWTLKHHDDSTTLSSAEKSPVIHYDKPDGIITFDKLSSVYLSNTYHNENQPSHLQLKDPSLAITVNYTTYASPESRYCPAGVYEVVDKQSEPRLQINAQNCIHCKTCDIKDPRQNIHWTAPEGGGGPGYMDM